jgi:hypothetical protein
VDELYRHSLRRPLARSRGPSFRRLSAGTTSPHDSWIASYRSFYTWGSAPTVSMNTARGLTTSQSMAPTTPTPTRRRWPCFVRGSTHASWAPDSVPRLHLQWARECLHWGGGCLSCSHGGREEEKASVSTFWGCSTQVPPGLHSTIRLAAWSPSIIVVGPPSTSAGGTTPYGLPAIVYFTLSSACYWGRLPVLQLRVDWALRSRVHPASIGLLN